MTTTPDPKADGLIERLRGWTADMWRVSGIDDDDKAMLTEAADTISGLTAERNEALREVSQWAREAGEAKGRLEMSEAAGIVDGWRERAEAAEAALAAERETRARMEAALRSARGLLGTYADIAEEPGSEFTETLSEIDTALNPQPQGDGHG